MANIKIYFQTEIAQVILVGMRRGLWQEPGTILFASLSQKTPQRIIVLLFLMLQMKKLSLRKAKPLTQGHKLVKCSYQGSNWSLVLPSQPFWILTTLLVPT